MTDPILFALKETKGAQILRGFPLWLRLVVVGWIAELSSDRESSPEGQKLQETPCFGGNYHAFNCRLWHLQFIALNASPTFLAEGVVSEVLALAMAQCANALPAHSLLAFSAFFALPEAGSCWDALWKKVKTRSFWRQGVEKATQKRLYKPWDLRRFKHW
jgi:hypothetical protein